MTRRVALAFALVALSSGVAACGSILGIDLGTLRPDADVFDASGEENIVPGDDGATAEGGSGDGGVEACVAATVDCRQHCDESVDAGCGVVVPCPKDCGQGFACNNNVCTCTPNSGLCVSHCSGHTDNCGNTCPNCPAGQTCVAGDCTGGDACPPEPDPSTVCGGRTCGTVPDPTCAGRVVACPPGCSGGSNTCSDAGTCCTAADPCNGTNCGPAKDNCGNTYPACTCTPPYVPTAACGSATSPVPCCAPESAQLACAAAGLCGGATTDNCGQSVACGAPNGIACPAGSVCDGTGHCCKVSCGSVSCSTGGSSCGMSCGPGSPCASTADCCAGGGFQCVNNTCQPPGSCIPKGQTCPAGSTNCCDGGTCAPGAFMVIDPAPQITEAGLNYICQ